MLDRFKKVLKRKLDAALSDEPHTRPRVHIDRKQLMQIDLTENHHSTEDVDVIAKGQPGKCEPKSLRIISANG